MVDRTELYIEGVKIISKVSVPDFVWINAIYLEEKSVNLFNVDIEGYGTILENTSPLSISAINLNIDYYNMKSGFIIQSP